MELRSSRSRSKTPFVALYETKNTTENTQNGTYTEESVVRTTRSTKVKSSASYGTIINNDTVSSTVSLEKLKSEKDAINKSKIRYTSLDYCSDDESSSNSSFNMNKSFKGSSSFLNISLNGGSSPVSALQVYRDAGEYWNKFPKTDWTYSPSSRDRIELAPGVIAMPNMSRRSLMHTYYADSSSVHTLNKQTSTDSYAKDTVDYSGLYQRQSGRLRSSYNSPPSNNSYKSHYASSSSSYSSTRNQTVFTRITSTFVSLWLLIQNSFSSVTETVHTKLNRSWISRSWMSLSSDTRRWLSLLFVLLLFFTGLWLLSSFITGPIAPMLIPNISQEEAHLVHTTDKSTFHQSVPQNSDLTQEQLNAIAAIVQRNMRDNAEADAESIVARVADSDKFKLLMLDLKSEAKGKDSTEHLKVLNDKLMFEINKVKAELLELERLRQEDVSVLVGQLRSENMANNLRLSAQLKRCCRSQIVYVESYVNKLLADILATPGGAKATPADVRNWLQGLFVAKEDLEARLNSATQHLRTDFDAAIAHSAKVVMDDVAKKITLELNAQLGSMSLGGDASGGGGLTEAHIKRIVRGALAVYDADKTGMVDYALEPSGGQVLSTRCTESYHARTAVMSILGIPLWYPMNTPRTVITPGITPGECWAFQNFPGFLVLKLTTRIRLTGFSMEHVPKALMPNGKIESAPKDFSVFGLRNETDKEPVALGDFRYDHDGSSLQHFAAAYDSDERFDLVEVRILSNHGNPNYTCLYRFRVHGTAANEQT